MMSAHSMNDIASPETLQSPGPGNGVGNNHGSAAGTSVTAGLPPMAAGRSGHIEGQPLDVPRASAESFGN